METAGHGTFGGEDWSCQGTNQKWGLSRAGHGRKEQPWGSQTWAGPRVAGARQPWWHSRFWCRIHRLGSNQARLRHTFLLQIVRCIYCWLQLVLHARRACFQLHGLFHVCSRVQPQRGGDVPKYRSLFHWTLFLWAKQFFQGPNIQAVPEYKLLSRNQLVLSHQSGSYG